MVTMKINIDLYGIYKSLSLKEKKDLYSWLVNDRLVNKKPDMPDIFSDIFGKA